MKLSQLIKEAQTQLAAHGDIDVLTYEDYRIKEIGIEKATQGQLEFWGMKTDQEYFFVRIYPDD